MGGCSSQNPSCLCKQHLYNHQTVLVGWSWFCSRIWVLQPRKSQPQCCFLMLWPWGETWGSSPLCLGQLQLQLWMIPHFPSLNQLLQSVLKVLWSWIRTSWGSGKWETPTWTMLGQGHSAMKTQMVLPKSWEICWVRQGFGVGMVWTSTEMSPPSLCLHQVTPGPSQLTLEVLLHHKSEQSTSLPSVLQNGV